MIHCEKEIQFRLPDIGVVDKCKREVRIVDIAIPGDARVCEKEIEKVDKYKPLKDEVARLWNMRKVTVILIVVGALGTISSRFEKFMKEVGKHSRVEHVKKTAILGTTGILKLVVCS